MPESIRLINPTDETTLRELPLATCEDADAAIAKARQAAPAWRAVAPADRARLMRRFADTIADHADELGRLETANMGMPIGSSTWCANAAADVIHYFAGAIDKHTGSTIPVAGGVDVTFHEPLGVVGLITPWNFPVLMASWKIGPALAAGNTAVIKPAEITPLTTMRLGELALEAGIPEGVLNVVVGTGAEVGWRLVEHRDVRKVAFTGSTAVGKRIMAGCADQVKRVTLELGGKSANIVFADADLEKAAAAAPGAVFDNSGQDCCARSRVLVERSVFDRFLELFVAAAGQWTVGDPMDPATAMGPLVTAQHLDTSAFVHRRPRHGLHRRGSVGPGLLAPDHDRHAIRCNRVHLSRRGLRPGRSRAAVRRRSGRNSDLQRQRLRTLRIGVDRAMARRHCVWCARWRPVRSASTRTAQSATARRSAASSRAGSVGSIRCTFSTTTPS